MRKVEFPSKDSPLREDVSLLGNLVGEMLREQGGEALFRTVERARQAAIVRRESGREEELESLVDSLSPDQSTWLVRAFAAYFQVANLAQKVHRIRRGREYLRRAHEAQPDSLEDVLLQLRRQGSSLEQIRELLDRMLIEPVFTAHPTESTRRSILEKEQRIARRLLERLNPSMTPPEEQACLARIRSEITAAWQTEEFPAMRPLVRDEREHVLFYLTDMPIASRYADLAGSQGEPVFSRIREEHRRTVESVLRLRQSQTLLERRPALRRSIYLRNPYVDPMSLLQVSLLSRWRAGQREDAELFQALLATVNGIANGLQSTG